MPRTDYEAAWHELATLVLSREGWGAKALAAEMTRLAAEHGISETLLERTLRLYGGELVLVAPTTEAPPSSTTVGMPTRAATALTPRQSEGGHDGYGSEHLRWPGRTGRVPA